MKRQITAVKIGDFFHRFESGCLAQGRAVPDVLLWEYDLLAGYIRSEEDFCRGAACYLRSLGAIRPVRSYLCAWSRGRGTTPRIRAHYGLWKTLDPSRLGLPTAAARETRLDVGGDFFFVGATELPEGLTGSAVLALGGGGRASRFVYLAREGSMADGDFLMRVLPEVFSGSGVPFFASFDLLPLFEAMPVGDGVVCLQHYGDGMAAYLMRKES